MRLKNCILQQYRNPHRFSSMKQSLSELKRTFQQFFVKNFFQRCSLHDQWITEFHWSWICHCHSEIYSAYHKWSYKSSSDNWINSYRTKKSSHQQVLMMHQFFLSRKRMTNSACVLIIECWTLRQYKIVMHCCASMNCLTDCKKQRFSSSSIS